MTVGSATAETPWQKDVTGEPVCPADVASLMESAAPDLRPYGALAVQTLLQPDEIWYEWMVAQAGIERRYIARFQIEGQVIGLTLLCATDANGWRVQHILPGDVALHAARQGNLAYRRA